MKWQTREGDVVQFGRYCLCYPRSSEPATATLAQVTSGERKDQAEGRSRERRPGAERSGGPAGGEVSSSGPGRRTLVEATEGVHGEAGADIGEDTTDRSM